MSNMKKILFFAGVFLLGAYPVSAGGSLTVGVVESCPTGGYVQVGRAYVTAVESAGFVPLVLPMTENEDTIRKFVEKIDILLLTGGEDVEPRKYGEKNSPKLGKVNLSRDSFEWKLLASARDVRLPIFGICRGEQMLNVFFGGTLYQDIPSEFPRVQSSPEVVHRVKDCKPIHKVVVKKDSRLGAVVGADELTVNTYHHQCVKDLAPGFIASAVSPDGVVEAIESADYPAAGVQFHPEKVISNADRDFSLEQIRKIFLRLPELVGRNPLSD
jgi:gamma-glutamyl-gamma-aminobutyrate hydrolase PuuD